jgi:hypothetical protein
MGDEMISRVALSEITLCAQEVGNLHLQTINIVLV